MFIGWNLFGFMFVRVELVRVRVCSAKLDQSEFVRPLHEPDQNLFGILLVIVRGLLGSSWSRAYLLEQLPDTALSDCFSRPHSDQHVPTRCSTICFSDTGSNFTRLRPLFLGNIHACHLHDESPTRALPGPDHAFSAATRLYSINPISSRHWPVLSRTHLDHCLINPNQPDQNSSYRLSDPKINSIWT